MSHHEAADAAVEVVRTGSSVAVGGFGLCGTPDSLIEALLRADSHDLHLVTNNCGPSSSRLTRLLDTGRVSRVTASYIGDNREFLRRWTGGSIAVDLVPQGTLAEKLRCGGSGIPAFFTPTGVGTAVHDGGIPVRHARDGSVLENSEPRRAETIHGVACVLEHSITVDVALIRAEVADTLGNLRFRGTARNFNPLCAMAGATTVAEVQKVVELGELAPDDVHLPCIFVSRVVDLDGQMLKLIERTGPVVAGASNPKVG